MNDFMQALQNQRVLPSVTPRWLATREIILCSLGFFSVILGAWSSGRASTSFPARLQNRQPLTALPPMIAEPAEERLLNRLPSSSANASPSHSASTMQTNACFL